MPDRLRRAPFMEKWVRMGGCPGIRGPLPLVGAGATLLGQAQTFPRENLGPDLCQEKILVREARGQRAMEAQAKHPHPSSPTALHSCGGGGP